MGGIEFPPKNYYTKSSSKPAGFKHSVPEVDEGYSAFADKFIAGAKVQPPNVSTSTHTQVSVPTGRLSEEDELYATKEELRIVTEKKNDFLDIIVKQADALKETRAVLKQKEARIRELESQRVLVDDTGQPF